MCCTYSLETFFRNRSSKVEGMIFTANIHHPHYTISQLMRRPYAHLLLQMTAQSYQSPSILLRMNKGLFVRTNVNKCVNNNGNNNYNNDSHQYSKLSLLDSSQH